MTQAGHDPRHRGVHEPGAGARQAGRQARRHLGVRVRALRDADRPPRVRGRRRVRHARGGSESASPTGARCRPRRRRRSAGCCAAVSQRTAKRRLRDIGDARLEIDERARAEPQPASAQRRRRRGDASARLVVGLALVVALAAAALCVWALRPTSPRRPRCASRSPRRRRPIRCRWRFRPTGRRLSSWRRPKASRGCGCVRWIPVGAAVDGDRRCDISVLVAGQPVHRVLCGRQAQADRYRRRIGQRSRTRLAARRYVEPGRHDPVCAARQLRSSVSPPPVVSRRRVRDWSRQQGSNFPAVSSRWPSLPLLRARQSRSPWRLCRSARRMRTPALARCGYRCRVCVLRAPALRPSGDAVCAKFDPVRLELTGNPFPVAEHVASGPGAQRCPHPAQVPSSIARVQQRDSGSSSGSIGPARRFGSRRSRQRQFCRPVALTRWPACGAVPQREMGMPTSGCSNRDAACSAGSRRTRRMT